MEPLTALCRRRPTATFVASAAASAALFIGWRRLSYSCSNAHSGTAGVSLVSISDNARFQFSERIVIPASQVFLLTPLTMGLVNLKPVVPGHVLVVPRRLVKSFSDMTADEVTDCWLTAQLVSREMQRLHGVSSTTFAIQDGPEAGQTVAHVHIHVLPRRGGEWPNGDQVYDEIDRNDKEMTGVDNDERKPRSAEEMKAEAMRLRSIFYQK